MEKYYEFGVKWVVVEREGVEEMGVEVLGEEGVVLGLVLFRFFGIFGD